MVRKRERNRASVGEQYNSINEAFNGVRVRHLYDALSCASKCVSFFHNECSIMEFPQTEATCKILQDKNKGLTISYIPRHHESLGAT